MPDLVTFIGSTAAFFTTVSYFPQLTKVWRTRETGDISLKMLLALATGLALWIVYGVMQGDYVIVGANLISVSLVSIILFFKLRELFR